MGEARNGPSFAAFADELAGAAKKCSPGLPTSRRTLLFCLYARVKTPARSLSHLSHSRTFSDNQPGLEQVGLRLGVVIAVSLGINQARQFLDG